MRDTVPQSQARSYGPCSLCSTPCSPLGKDQGTSSSTLAQQYASTHTCQACYTRQAGSRPPCMCYVHQCGMGGGCSHPACLSQPTHAVTANLPACLDWHQCAMPARLAPLTPASVPTAHYPTRRTPPQPTLLGLQGRATVHARYSQRGVLCMPLRMDDSWWGAAARLRDRKDMLSRREPRLLKLLTRGEAGREADVPLGLGDAFLRGVLTRLTRPATITFSGRGCMAAGRGEENRSGGKMIRYRP